MDRSTRRAVEEYRHNEAGPIENNLIDELVGGELDRSEFLRRGTMFGLSAGMLGSLLTFVGEAGAAPAVPQSFEAVKAGGTLKAGIQTPGGPVEPYLLNDGGALAFAGIPGEYLTFTNPKAQLVPMLATSWKPNKDASVWTFQLRKGVKFHDGQEMTSKDVVASFKQYVGVKSSNAGLAPFFDASGVSAAGKYTVVFRLKAPLGAFPYLLSQTTYQAIIQRAKDAANPGTWVKNGMIGTGAFKLKAYQEKRSAQLVRNTAYWGGPVPLDGVNVTFFTTTSTAALALRAGQVDVVMQLSPQEAQPFKNNSKFIYYSQPVSAHRQICMRTDKGVLTDARIRRALALTINRPAQIVKVMLGNATVGNDGPFWKQFLTTPEDIKQRKQNIQLAKALLKAANAENLEFNITTWRFADHPDHAASFQAYARDAGVKVGIEVMDYAKYYDSEPAGADYATTTPWLNRTCTLTEYGWRGVPNMYLSRCYMSTGDWNAAHYKNPKFDAVAKTYLEAPDLKTQQAAVKKMAGILLLDTPVITDYFINYVTASSSKVKGYVPEGISQMGTGLRKTSLA